MDGNFTNFRAKHWSRCAELNRGPTPYHGVALPTELQRQIQAFHNITKKTQKIKTASYRLKDYFAIGKVK